MADHVPPALGRESLGAVLETYVAVRLFGGGQRTEGPWDEAGHVKAVSR